MRYVKILFFLVILLSANFSFADSDDQSPLFTGPLLAAPGDTPPAGSFNFEPYFFYTDSYGIYNNRGRVVPVPSTFTSNPTFVFMYGLATHLQLQFVVSAYRNSKDGQHYTSLGDPNVQLAYQFFEQKDGTIIPDFTFTAQESFPISRYKNLNPARLGTDAIGSGSYETTLSFNLQKLFKLFATHYLNARFNFTLNLPHHAKVSGFNTYGGGIGTAGTVYPGHSRTLDLGLEYTLTHHWVGALDIVLVKGSGTGFVGNLGVSANGLPASMTSLRHRQFSLAPAIEYNFNETWGVIGGVWFSVNGKNSTDFKSAVLAINYYIPKLF